MHKFTKWELQLETESPHTTIFRMEYPSENPSGWLVMTKSGNGDSVVFVPFPMFPEINFDNLFATENLTVDQNNNVVLFPKQKILDTVF